MKLIIDIPEDDYKFIKDLQSYNYPDVLIAKYAHYIKDGIPLPKGHGDLIDKNEYFQGSFNDAREFLDKATTIIKADTAVILLHFVLTTSVNIVVRK